MQQFHPPYRGRGGGYGPPSRGYGGGYPPQYGYGGPPRGFRPPRNHRGRFPRQGQGYGRGQYFPRPHAQRGRTAAQDGEDPYYHLSMFENPWRFLLPQGHSKDIVEITKSTELDSGVAKVKSEVVTGDEAGGTENRTECTQGEVKEEAKEEVKEEGNKKEVEDLKDPATTRETDGGSEECRNGEGGVEGEGGEEGAAESVEKAAVKDAELAREDEDTASSTTAAT